MATRSEAGANVRNVHQASSCVHGLMACFKCSDSIVRLVPTPTLFSEAVVAAARETQAHVHLLSHDVCLLSWNLTEPCRHHANHACQAAVADRSVRC